MNKTHPQRNTDSAHTPGPWHLGMAAGDVAAYGPKGEHIATLPSMLNEAEVLANARLIAACPRMFDFVAKMAATGGCPEAQSIIDSLR